MLTLALTAYLLALLVVWAACKHAQRQPPDFAPGKITLSKLKALSLSNGRSASKGFFAPVGKHPIAIPTKT
jgi:hypothetical protein